MPPSICRSWCYTLNNYTDDELATLRAMDPAKVKVHVCGREVGENGTPHLQGYVRFDKPCRLAFWKKTCPRAHVEQRQGTELQAWDYCVKDNNILIQVGTPVRNQEYSTRDAEVTAIVQKIHEGAEYPEIFDAHKKFCFWHHREVFTHIAHAKCRRRSHNPWLDKYHDSGSEIERR